jgi:hypothetical protein
VAKSSYTDHSDLPLVPILAGSDCCPRLG